MSTHADVAGRTRSAAKGRSISDLWNQPRIADAHSRELGLSRTRIRDYTDGSSTNRETGQRGVVALAARWRDSSIGRAALEIHDRTAFIRVFHVDTGWRKHGVGRRLLRSLLAKARLQRVSDIYVGATAADAGFYALYGFRPVDEHGLDERITVSELRECDGEDYLVLKRHLTFPFLNASLDRITVKM